MPSQESGALANCHFDTTALNGLASLWRPVRSGREGDGAESNAALVLMVHSMAARGCFSCVPDIARRQHISNAPS
jgi:hypothetical protein